MVTLPFHGLQTSTIPKLDSDGKVRAHACPPPLALTPPANHPDIRFRTKCQLCSLSTLPSGRFFLLELSTWTREGRLRHDLPSACRCLPSTLHQATWRGSDVLSRLPLHQNALSIQEDGKRGRGFFPVEVNSCSYFRTRTVF